MSTHRIFSSLVAGIALMWVSVAQGSDAPGLTPVVAQTSPKASAGRYEGDSWALLDSKAIEAAGAEITPATFPNCDEATVDAKSVRVYRSDGTGESQDETFTKVLTEKGKNNNRTLNLSYMIPYNTLEVVLLEVIHPDGKVTPVDIAANSNESIDDSQMEMNIYDPNNRIVRVNIPQLEPGDIVHSVVRQNTDRSYIPGEFAEENLFEGIGYIRHASYEVRAPESKPLNRIVIRDEVPGTIQATRASGPAGTLIYHWDINKVPRMYEEPAMPPFEAVLQRLLVSTLPDWQAVSKWYWKLSQPHLDTISPDMKKTVADLVAGKTTDQDRLKAIFYYVSKNIRYMGLTPEKDRPGFEPHDVCLTFDKKYGVCRDKAALLVSMLRAAGFEAYPVLISYGTRKDTEVADAYFNHAIAAVVLKKGEYTLMDATDENTRDFLPSEECNQSYLVCRPEGETIQMSPIKPADQNLMRIQTTGRLDASGTLRATCALSCDGINDNVFRGALARMKPDDRRRLFEAILKIAVPGAHLQSLKITPDDMFDLSVPVFAEFSFTASGMTASSEGKAIVSLPWIGKYFGVVSYVLQSTVLEKRKYPLETFVACGVREQISIALDPAFTAAASLPTCTPVDDGCTSYRESVDFKGGSLIGSRELKLKVVEFDPAQYLALKQTLKLLSYDERKAPVMDVAEHSANAAGAASEVGAELPVESDSKLLEDSVTITVNDAHSMTRRLHYVKQILTYNGKKNESEVKIPYNPACGEAKIIHAVVISKDGQRKEISPGEMNAMDAPWNASAKRYTGGKTLVANLPGVEIGSTIDVEVEIVSRNKPFVSHVEAFELPDSLVKKTVELTAPASLPLQFEKGHDGGQIKQEVRSEGDRRVYRWTAENIKALPAERDVPPSWAFLTELGFFAGDMDAYLKEADSALLARSAKSAKASDLARRLAGQATTRLEAVKAIRDYVSRNIRTAGPAFTELPLSELSDADTTLSEGYGHLADQAILLHAMLTAAGLHPQILLASRLPSIPGIKEVATGFPLPGSFDWPLVRIVLDGETYYLNDTDQYGQLGSTPHEGKLALALDTRTIETIRAAKGCSSATRTTYTLVLSDQGKLRVSIVRKYYGDDFNEKHRFFAELPPEETRRYFEEAVTQVTQGARPVGGLKTEFDTYPATEEFTVEIDSYAVADGKFMYFDLPFRPEMTPLRTDHRALPFFINRDHESNIRAVLTLPPGFHQVVIAPKAQTYAEPDGAGMAQISRTTSGGTCTVDYELDVSPAIVSPADYPAMARMESELENRSSRLFLLEHDASP